MKKISEFSSNKIEFVFTDIDDTLTTEGKLIAESYSALWRLQDAGFKVILVTGRPAGWCDALARQWPVDGVIGENGGFYFVERSGGLKRRYVQPALDRKANNLKRRLLWQGLKIKFPKVRRAADQFARKLDLAIDVCEDEPALSKKQTEEILHHLRSAGATAKLSSIHINAWYGDFDKATTCLLYLKEVHGVSKVEALEQSVYLGDSPNDEPLFALFPHSIGVQNVEKFLDQMAHRPSYITEAPGGLGFAEAAQVLLHKRAHLD